MTSRTRAAPEPVLVVLGYTCFHAVFFSPVLFGPSLLAPDDGWTYFLPAFLSAPTKWTDLLFAGYPVLADPQMQSLYPVARLFAALPAGWDPYVVCGYVLASSFAYGFIRGTGGSPLAAAVAGLVYGSSGFLVAHLRHVTFVHAAAWLPLLLWGLERLRRRSDAMAFATISSAACLLALAGSPQMLVYALGLAAAYAIFLAAARRDRVSDTVWTEGSDGRSPGRQPTNDRARTSAAYLVRAGAATALGIGLASVQLLPAAELAGLSTRATFSYADFGSYALAPGQLVLLVLPYAQGGAFGVPYRGPWNLAELSGWVGLLPLLLATVALLRGRPRARIWFWAGVALVSTLLALGNATPLGWLFYHLPAYGLFKVPARHFLELSIAVAALAAMGVDAVLARVVSLQSRAAAAAAVTALFLAAAGLCVAGLLPDRGSAAAAPTAALLVPAAVLVASGAAFMAWSASPDGRVRQLTLIAFVALDLASFGWFFEWRVRAPSSEGLKLPPVALRLRDALQASGQRLLPASGHVGGATEMPVNLSRVWGVPSAAGYSPLIFERLAKLVPMAYWGAPRGSWASPENRALDLLAVGYVTMPAAALAPDPVVAPGSEPPPGVVLGSGCGGNEASTWTYTVPPGAVADSVEIVTSMACSTSVPQGAPVLEVAMAGASAPLAVLRAGVETAEWLIDCPGVRETVSHGRPRPAGGWPLPAGSSLPAGACEWHAWAARVSLPDAEAGRSLRLRFTGPAGAVRVHRIALMSAGRPRVIDPQLSALQATERWQVADHLAGDVLLYENRRALPRAWLAPRAVVVTPEKALQTIHGSALPNGAPFDPREIALVEERVRLPADPRAGGDTAGAGDVEIRAREGGEMELRVRARAPVMLVTSDAWHPGWKATVDGDPVRVLRVDYALRGVRVPAGAHTVRFRFEPRSLRRGTAVSAVSGLLLLAAVAVFRRRSRVRPA